MRQPLLYLRMGLNYFSRNSSGTEAKDTPHSSSVRIGLWISFEALNCLVSENLPRVTRSLSFNATTPTQLDRFMEGWSPVIAWTHAVSQTLSLCGLLRQ